MFTTLMQYCKSSPNTITYRSIVHAFDVIMILVIFSAWLFSFLQNTSQILNTVAPREEQENCEWMRPIFIATGVFKSIVQLEILNFVHARVSLAHVSPEAQMLVCLQDQEREKNAMIIQHRTALAGCLYAFGT